MSKKYLLCFVVSLFATHLLFAGKIIVVEVSPAKINLKPGQKYSFVAHAFDAQGNEVFFKPEWQASGGKINQDGVFIAGGNSGIFEVIASHAETGAHGSASVMIDFRSTQFPKQQVVVTSKVKVQSLRLTPGSISVKPRQKVQFIVQAFDNRGKSIKPPKRLIWKVSSGSITPSGLYQAGGRAGVQNVQVRTYDGIYANAQVYVNTAPGRISRIEVSPSLVNLKPGDQYRFFATAYNNAGKIVALSPRWKATGGNIDSNGMFYAGSIPGTYIVEARNNRGTSGTATININRTYISDVEVLPKSAVLSPGQTQQFTLRAYGRDGKLVNVYPSWSATGGVIQPNGVYQAGNITGDYKLNATVENFSLNVQIKIRHQKRLVRIEIAPSYVKLSPGQTFQFNINGYDQYGKTVPLRKININSTGGRINSKGLYVAGQRSGNFSVEISTPQGLKSVTNIEIGGGSQNTVSANTTDNTATNNNNQKQNNMSGGVEGEFGEEADTADENPAIKWLTVSPQFAPTSVGKQVQFQAKGYDASGKEVDCDIKWRCTGGKISSDGIFIAGNKPGKYKVQARVGKVKMQANVVVKAAPKAPKKQHRLVVIPPKVVLKAGQRCTFNAQIRGDLKKAPKLQWSASGGKVNNNGDFVAGNEPGKYTITVEEKSLGIKTEVPVVIEKAPEPPKSVPGALHITRWYVKTSKSGLASIHIEGKMLLDDARMLKLLLHRRGDEELVYQLFIKKNQRFSIQGNYYVAGGTKLEIVLYDSDGKVLHRESK
ncbi:hypothetical protein [Candidatus Uabimicrobium amorphum]|uniref:Ig-like domain-containing protein n=1 Tax=Uabimicrobium amorphum TaxID=2596890 RepID=A0A5S9IIJ1_UABAM|nr:hypothetical protein [Candidatus Uabimicrobium amorphum]BBM82488.1 hypothetical protein UABAM_00831 [Candidatus Uabimicrobium amorphum]